MSIVSLPRKEIGIRTIFNLLGPMCNPCHVKKCVVGVAKFSTGPVMAEALRLSGVTRGMVICGAEGLDEVILWFILVFYFYLFFLVLLNFHYHLSFIILSLFSFFFSFSFFDFFNL